MAAQRYRKKPVEVDAVQWTGDWSAVIDWLDEITPNHPLVPFGQEPGIFRQGDELVLTTVHGEKAIARPGDWIIPEPQENRYYPCKPDIFADTYEEVSG